MEEIPWKDAPERIKTSNNREEDKQEEKCMHDKKGLHDAKDRGTKMLKKLCDDLHKNGWAQLVRSRTNQTNR